ncbi:MAG: FKBP-type peptidyl-prolyl cis-trans isomerase [Porticoccaceae bacterium]|jgi:FKBP-type peptidyl-prolyl cis-trans isomerase|nr:FKBP-type peptidyl-prolyl cis-trans isomerase [Porticoccaceae bacterium]MBT5577924.1 FKBP-type peptidyl-prolyl cis-trans isomerase [Porticoccaceae bacterium]MBT7376120.1 FKBP-type peptidyl-prolyl cis-trans isomerase [Porticoccaceae bacterium]
MNRLKLLSLTALLALAGCDTMNNQPQEAELQTQDQKISYLLGMDNGKNIQTIGIEIDTQAFQQGFSDGLSNAEPQLTEEDIAATIQAFEVMMTAKRDEMQQAEQQATQMQAEANLQEGSAFLAENGAKEGVTTTDTGLQYKVLVAGTGDKPGIDSMVEVHYSGRLLDGTEFDSSVKRGVPAQFGVTQVIAGWTEALQLMSEGAKWELYIPADLAYGPGGTGPIGPNATLIFEVELLQANIASE